MLMLCEVPVKISDLPVLSFVIRTDEGGLFHCIYFHYFFFFFYLFFLGEIHKINISLG